MEKIVENPSAPKEPAEIDLNKLAAEELLRDAERNASRADSYGSTAWKKGPVPKPNMNFLARAVSGTVIQNARMDRQRDSPTRRANYQARHQTAQCQFRSEGLEKAVSDRSQSSSGRNGEREGKGDRRRSPRRNDVEKRDLTRKRDGNHRSRSPDDRRRSGESQKSQDGRRKDNKVDR